MERLRNVTLALALTVVGAGCTASDPDDPLPLSPAAPTPLPLLEAASLSDEVVLSPSHAILVDPDPRSPAVPENRQAMLDEGYGEVTVGGGESHVQVAPPAETPPDPGSNAKLLVRFAHLTDIQLSDDESPSRMAFFDAAQDATSSAFRPQEGHFCRLVNAMVRTLNAVHAENPVAFVLLGGDNIDNAQQNELEWLLRVFGGDPWVECDSGADDDPIPGPDNDPKDPFVAAGLDMPWYWVTGNHDVLRQGNFPIDDYVSEVAIGDNAAAGTRDWSRPGGPLFGGPVVPDAGRRLLYADELLELVAMDADGHGVGEDQMADGKAQYTFDVSGTPLRFVVLDTAGLTGASDGLIREQMLTAFVEPALLQAQADGKWVVLASHHATSSLGDGSGFGGSAQADAVLAPEWEDFVGSFPNVVLSLVGHSHEHRIKYLEPAGGSAWWEVMTSALADYPQQIRLVEIWDQDNGWIMLRATGVDFAIVDDVVATEGRSLGVLDMVSGWEVDGRGEPTDRNVEVWIPAPS